MFSIIQRVMEHRVNNRLLALIMATPKVLALLKAQDGIQPL
jgi:hypothetical protein